MLNRRRVLSLVLSLLTIVLAGANAPRAYAAGSDIVLWAADAKNLNGHWSLGTDSSAAGGQAVTSTDTGWASADAVLAAPANYFEFAFSAPANTPYHVWMRIRAGANSKFNDSVYAQFSDSTDPNGSAIYRIGTTSGLNVNLQTCSGCALSGWGWMDGAYWLSQVTTVKFATTGTHTLRIQTREDGTAIDQVVLSQSAFLTRAPGQAMNDATILPRSGGTSSGSTSTSTPTPYSGTPVAIPGTVNAENFDNGGEGVGYHDTTGGNVGGVYRQTDVDLEASTDGGYDIGWTDGGEWVSYAVSVASGGSYSAQVRVASPSGATMHIAFNGASTAVSVPATGGWQTWTTVTVPVTLSSGTQQLKVIFDNGGANFRYVKLAAVSTVSAPSTGAGPYSGTPIESARQGRGGELRQRRRGLGLSRHDERQQRRSVPVDRRRYRVVERRRLRHRVDDGRRVVELHGECRRLRRLHRADPRRVDVGRDDAHRVRRIEQRVDDRVDSGDWRLADLDHRERAGHPRRGQGAADRSLRQRRRQPQLRERCHGLVAHAAAASAASAAATPPPPSGSATE